MPRRCVMTVGLGWLVLWSGARAAEMSAGDVKMRPRSTANITVSGEIDGEKTFAWSVLLEIVPREGSRGTVEFTPAPKQAKEKRPSFVVAKNHRGVDTVRLAKIRRPGVDIQQLEDVWPDAGTFSAYDTQRAGSRVLNGAVDENGTFLAGSVTFSGPLAVFPVIASRDAQGVFDVVLWTDAGDSGWEGIETELIAGTITVSPDVCANKGDCNDRDPCTEDICDAGVCKNIPRSGECNEQDDPRSRKRGPRRR